MKRFKHGHALFRKRTRTYIAWVSLRQRCNNPKSRAYPDYGGRGIGVCARWQNSFESFLEDMGVCPEGQSIDRINNDGNYEPTNCRWATSTEQTRNYRQNVMVTYNGETLCVKDWALKLGIHQPTLWYRLNKGWGYEKAFTTPIMESKAHRRK